MKFELKGGTSLSKGFQIIDRFSEDKAEPKYNGVDAKDYHDWLAQCEPK